VTRVAFAWVLVLLVLACSWPALVRSPARLQWPALPAEMLLPGLFHEGGGPALPWLIDRRPSPEAHLPLAALRGTILSQHEFSEDSVTVGFLPLLLAAFGLFAGSGALARAGRITLGFGAGFTALAAWWPSVTDWPGSVAILVLPCLGIALLAGAGLLRLGQRAPDGQGEGPAMALGAAAVLLAAVLIALSMQAGAITDARVVQPLLDRPGVPWEHDVLRTPEAIARNAAWLRAVLDRAALAAFASMCALLLHLKSRSTWTAVLVLLAVVADLLSVRWLL